MGLSRFFNECGLAGVNGDQVRCHCFAVFGKQCLECGNDGKDTASPMTPQAVARNPIIKARIPAMTMRRSSRFPECLSRKVPLNRRRSSLRTTRNAEHFFRDLRLFIKFLTFSSCLFDKHCFFTFDAA